MWNRRMMMAGLAGLGAAWPLRGFATAYPDHPINLVIAFPPGGTSTYSSKPVVDRAAAQLGQPVALDYRPGAGGNVAAVLVKRAAADGYTLFYGHAGPLCINHHINPQTFFDPVKDFRPITLSVGFPLVLAVQPGLGVDTPADFVRLARSGKTELVFGSSGNGSIQHLAGELFKAQAGIDYLHVPFAGGGPLQKAFLDGTIQVLFETGSNVIAHLQSGRMKALAVMAPQRLPVLPAVPTMTEAGFSGLDVEAWFGFLAPAGTPAEVVARLDREFQAALADRGVRAELDAIAARVIGAGPQAFAAHIAAEDTRWAKVVKSANVKPD